MVLESSGFILSVLMRVVLLIGFSGFRKGNSNCLGSRFNDWSMLRATMEFSMFPLVHFRVDGLFGGFSFDRHDWSTYN